MSGRLINTNVPIGRHKRAALDAIYEIEGAETQRDAAIAALHSISLAAKQAAESMREDQLREKGR